jgi:hypothetical protein
MSLAKAIYSPQPSHEPTRPTGQRGHALGPCPWCGDRNHGWSGGTPYVSVMCETCDATGPRKGTYVEAMAAWNTPAVGASEC